MILVLGIDQEVGWITVPILAQKRLLHHLILGVFLQ